MKVIICKDALEVSKEAFKVMKEVISSTTNPVLGLATGSSPIPLYERLIEDHNENHTDYTNVTTFNLDEYVGLPKEHVESYYSFMHKNLFNGIEIPEENVHLPSGLGNLEENCKHYEELLSKVKVDVQLLGIGSNGHIGFNEPGTAFDSKTHIVTLKESTRKDNARFFDCLGEEVPTEAITMGIGTIMNAKKILLIATGENKANAVEGMINGPITEDMPASILQNHPDVVVIVDEKAASKLSK